MMHVIKPIDIKQNVELIFSNLLTYLNQHPDVRHVTLISDTVLSSQEEKHCFINIVKQCVDRLQYAITPSPIIDVLPSVLQNETTSKATEVISTDIRDATYESPPVFALSPNILREDVDTLVVSIDFDGCADTEEVRKRIRQDILDMVTKSPSIKRIVIFIGSLRQSLENDYYNARLNAHAHEGKLLSCHELGAGFLDKLREDLSTLPPTLTPVTVEFEPLLISDLLNDLEKGTTYKALCAFHRKLMVTPNIESFIIRAPDQKLIDLLCFSSKSSVTHSKEWTDLSKISTIVIQMQYVTQEHLKTTGKKAHFRFYDDRYDILENLYFYLEMYHLVPEGIYFDCAQNMFELFQIHFAAIQGTGMAISDYKGLLHHFAAHTPTPAGGDHVSKNNLVSLHQAYIAQLESTNSKPSRLEVSTGSAFQEPHRPIPRKAASFSLNFFDGLTSGEDVLSKVCSDLGALDIKGGLN